MHLRCRSILAAAGLCWPILAATHTALAQPLPDDRVRCRADFNGDTVPGDIFDLFDFLAALENGLDYNADTTPGDIFDLFDFLADLDRGCQPVIVNVEPPRAQPGDVVCIIVDNLPLGVTNKDFCILDNAGNIFDVRDIAIDPATGRAKLFVTLFDVQPGAAGFPGKLMIQVGRGDCITPTEQPDPNACFAEPIFRWVPNGQIPMAQGGDFTALPGNPTNKTFQEKWTLENGRQCLLIPKGFTLKRCDEVETLIRLWCPTRFPDVNIPRIVACRDYTSREFADLLCRALVLGFTSGQQVPPINEIDCRVIDAGNFWKVSVGYTDCEVIGGVASTGLLWSQVTVCANADDCDEVCAPKGPVVIGVDPPTGGTGDEVCIFVRGLPEGIEAKDLCILHDGGVVFNPKQLSVDPASGIAKITACAFTVGDQPLPGGFNIQVGVGECVTPPNPDPNACFLDPVSRWIPLPEFPVIQGGAWGPNPDNDPTKVFSENWTLENGQQKLFIPDNFRLLPCDVVEILLRLWCPIRTPDINIPRIAVCAPLNAEQFANLLCRAIVDAFNTGGGFVPPINEVRCVVQRVPGGWLVCLGYTDCEVTGGVAETGLPWTRVTVCRDAVPNCNQVCNKQPGPQPALVIPDRAGPNQPVQIIITDWPANKRFTDICVANENGALFDVRGLQLADADNDGLADDAILFAITAGQPPRVLPGQPGRLMIKCGLGDRNPIRQQVPGFELGEAWVWQPENADEPAIMGEAGFTPNGDPAGAPASITANFDTNPASPCFGDITFKIQGPFTTGTNLSIFLRAYCPVRAPDVHIPDIAITAANPTPLQVANALCAAILAAYTDAGIPQIECFVLPLGGGMFNVCVGYSDCDVNGPTWGAGGTNPSVITINP